MVAIRRAVVRCALVALVGVLVPASDARTDEPPAVETERTLASLAPLGFRTPSKSPLVKDGLRWLASAQDARGGWSARMGDAGNPAYDVGVTALAVLAYLGAGYTPEGPEPHGRVVERGIRRILENQDEAGRIGGRGTGNSFYEHAYGTLALVEAYAMTGSKSFLEPAQRAVAFVHAARNPYFAWRYGVKPGENDTSITGTMAVVLAAARAVNRAAQAGGLRPPFPPDDDAWEGVRAWIDRMTDPETGRVGYQERGGRSARIEGTHETFPSDATECLTALATLARIRSGEGLASDVIRKGQACFARLPPTWDRPAERDLCFWFFGSQAQFLLGGTAWTKWQSALVAALAKGAIRGDTGAYWPAVDAWGEAGGTVYTTAMALLCLETEGRCHRDPPDVRRLLSVAADVKEDTPFRRRALEWLALRPQKGSVGALAPILSTEPKELRALVAAALGALGAVAVDPLARSLARERDEETRVACARALGGTGAAKAAPPLLAALRDAGPAVRAAAARALGELREAKDETAPALEEATRDADRAVAGAAREALDRLRSPVASPPSVPSPHPGSAPLDVLDAAAVAAAIESDARRDDAIARIRSKGPASVPTLHVLARHEHASVRATALSLLAEVVGPDGGQSAAALLAGASDADGAVRAAAVRGLGLLTAPSPDARAALLRALADSDLNVVEAALRGQEKRPTGDVEAAKAVGRLVSKEPAAYAIDAARLLERWALAEQESTDALLAAVDDARRPVRAAAVDALGAVAAKVPRAVDGLAPLLSLEKDPDFERVWTIFRGLGEKGVAPIADCLRSSEEGIRRRALDALRRLGPAAAGALPALIDFLAAETGASIPHDLAMVFTAMGRAGLDALLRALEDERATLRASTARVLGAMGKAARSALGPLARAKAREKDTKVLTAITVAILDIEHALGR